MKYFLQFEFEFAAISVLGLKIPKNIIQKWVFPKEKILKGQ